MYERFWSKVDSSGGADACWPWKAGHASHGYGWFRLGSRTDGSRKQLPAHRVAYTMVAGEIPDGFVIDHLCRNRLCCNPEHLEPVTHRENILRGNGACARHARLTHCKHGHPYDEANTRRDTHGHRRCSACELARVDRRRDARQAAARLRATT